MSLAALQADSNLLLSYSCPLPDHSHASWNYDLSSYEAKRLLHIVDGGLSHDHGLEQTSTTTDSRETAVSEVTWKSSHPVHDGGRGLSRANSDLAIYAPVRRRSVIQVPGVATRRNSVSSAVIGGAALAQQMFWSSVPVTANLSRQASFESPGSRVMSMPPMPALPPMPSLLRPHDSNKDMDPVPRVSTPCDRDYQAIGAFKLGSLRITNGSVSPLSSPERTRTCDEETSKDHPGCRNLESDVAARTQALADFSGNGREQGNVGSDSEPVVDQIRQGNEADNRDTDLQPFPLYAEQPSSPVAEIGVGPFRDSGSVPTDISGTGLPQIALSDDTFAGFEFSLFSLDDITTARLEPRVPSALGLQTTSKNSAMEDDLFEDESDAPEYLTDEVLDVRLDPNAKSAGGRSAAAVLANGKNARNVQCVSRSDSGMVSSPTSEASSKPLSKADSGYSSNVSLRSFKQAASKFMSPVTGKAAMLASDASDSMEPKLLSPNVPNIHVTVTPPHREVPPLLSHSFSTVRSNDTPLVSPASAAFSWSSSTGAPAVLPATSNSNNTYYAGPDRNALCSKRDTGAQASLSSKRQTIPLSLENLPPSKRANSYPTVGISPGLSTPSSAKSGSSASNSSIGSGNRRSSRLRRLFRPGAAVHGGERKPDVPSAPQDVQAKPYDRADLFPATRRRLALRTQVSKDTLKTIFSVGSLEAYSALELQANGPAASLPSTTAGFLSPTEESSVPSQRRPLDRRHTFQNVPSSLAHVAASVMPSRKAAHKRSRLGQTVLEPTEDAEMDGKGRTRMDNEDGRGAKSKQRGKPMERALCGSKTDRGGKNDDTGMLSPVRVLRVEVANGNDSVFTASEGQRDPPPSASSRIRSRTMSLTAQLERSLNLRLHFSRGSRPTTADAADAENAKSKQPAAASGPPPSLSLPTSPMWTFATSAGTSQGEHAVLTLPTDRRGPSDQHGYFDLPDGDKRSANVHERSRSVFPSHIHTNVGHPGAAAHPSSLSSVNGTSSRLRHRASYDSFNGGASIRGRWRSGSGGSSGNSNVQQQQQQHQQLQQQQQHQHHQQQQRQHQHHHHHQHQQQQQPQQHHHHNNNQQQKSWDHYYQQHAVQPPPYGPRGYHHRHQSTGSNSGTQAPYRILHSYNSPAYRGAAIWG